MPLKWIVLLVLSFPAVEIVGLFWLAAQIGWWVMVWLVIAGIAGLALIRFERAAWSMRLLSTLQSGTHAGASLFASGRVLLAGGLLLFPGFISDILAVVLLLLPGTSFKRRTSVPRAANDDVLEGEFQRERDDNGRLP